MKTTKLLRLSLLVIAILGLSLTGCKKDKNSNSSPDTSSLQQLSADEETMQSAMDESMNDVNNLLSGGNLKSTEHRVPCNAIVDSTAVANDTITIYITYNGLNCNGTRNRTGKVEIRKQAGTHWSQQGATVIIKHINLTITKVKNQKTITLNGVKVYQNVSGGLVWQLGNGLNTIVHRISGQVTVTFPDTTTRIWYIARQKTFTGTAPDNLILICDGFGSADGFDNLEAWGINRKGENFYSQILQSVTRKQACDWDPSAGIKKHSIPADLKSATLTFGYNSDDQPITGDECPTKYKLDYQKNNHSGSMYLWL